MVLGGCEISAPKPSSSSSSPVAKKDFRPAIVGVQSGTNKGTGFIIGYDDKNNIVYILTQEHIVRGDPCPQVNFGTALGKAYKKEAGGNYGDTHARERDNALALLFVQPNFEGERMKLQLRGDCDGIARETVLTYNYRGEPATVDTSSQNGEICTFNGNSGIMNGYSGSPLIKEDSSSVIGVISEFDPKVKAVSADTVLKFIKGIKESGIGESIMKLMEKPDNTFTTRNHAPYSSPQCPVKNSNPVESSEERLLVTQTTRKEEPPPQVKSPKPPVVKLRPPLTHRTERPPQQGVKCECGTIHSKREMYLDLTEFENSCLEDGHCPALK